ncbi:MAG: DEAD/DEAH box helicase [Phycisphaerae bacterium]|nr:DEAD/DEAH box helicase [Phycisphaerae bacterium]
MIVLHAQWSGSRLWLWAESIARLHAPAAEPDSHPFAAPTEDLARWHGPNATTEAISLRLPARDGRPEPSPRLAHAAGLAADDARDATPTLATFRVPALGLPPSALREFFASLEDRADSVSIGPSLAYLRAGFGLACHCLAQQRFVPGLFQRPGGVLLGQWQPWLADEATAERLAALIHAMPPAARAAVDGFAHDPWSMLEDFLVAATDAECRRVLAAEDMASGVRERDPSGDPPVFWLRGLLDADPAVDGPAATKTDLIRNVRRWIGGLEDRGASSTWRLLLRLNEPPENPLEAKSPPQGLQDPGDSLRWPLTFHLQSQEDPRVVVDAPDIWLLPTDAATVEGRRLDGPHELLLGELARAARIFPPLERALDDAEPVDLELSTRHAYEFLREIAGPLREQGFGVQAPEWWDRPSARLGARLKLVSDPAPASPSPGSQRRGLGLASVVSYSWDISLGGVTLSLDEFQKLAAQRSPLLRINGRWVEVRPEDVRAAHGFIKDNPGGEMSLGQAIRLAYAVDAKAEAVPIVGLEATGWVADFLGGVSKSQKLAIVAPPAGFHGSLRPYQLRGVSWLAFLESLGFGPCLADDMGLGKTIQVLALLAHERTPDEIARAGKPGPTLLVVPMSVVGNWQHEAKRFCPELRVLTHHGPERLAPDRLARAAADFDAVITTYALAHRDREALARVAWQRVVLDEAQYIKNAETKQAQAVRALPAATRLALTGTPVENRLGELWSIFDFLNPGYLGSPANFRKRFAVPVELRRDADRAKQLSDLVRPFLLRRLKSDPTVAADLPEKLETREYAHLTTEQAELYESIVRRMMTQVEDAEGIRRKGLVLAMLVKLKQACDHPSLVLGDHEPDAPTPPIAARSGKCIRLVEMLDEVIASGERALVFTQFRRMAELLAAMLRHDLDRDVLLFHGGTTATQRQALVERFQRADDAAPVMVVSLRAGGLGLNLTAATHVFHFDRWWNPAVENQATDRAHRIGQFRTVQVHKFVVRGTLEERIDAMIESKTELAKQVIGSGEAWLTELDTSQLRDILTLRRDAVDDGE